MMPGSSKAMPILPAEAEIRVPGGTASRSDGGCVRPAGDVFLGRDVFDQDGELVPAETGRRVEGPQALGEIGGHALEQLISFPVAQAVVHRLEVVEVDEEHGQVGAREADAGQRVFEAVLEQRLVGQSGQRVVEGPVLELVLQADAVGDVTEAPDTPDHDAVDRLGPGRQLEGVARP